MLETDDPLLLVDMEPESVWPTAADSDDSEADCEIVLLAVKEAAADAAVVFVAMAAVCELWKVIFGGLFSYMRLGIKSNGKKKSKRNKSSSSWALTERGEARPSS